MILILGSLGLVLVLQYLYFYLNVARLGNYRSDIAKIEIHYAEKIKLLETKFDQHFMNIYHPKKRKKYKFKDEN